MNQLKNNCECLFYSNPVKRTLDGSLLELPFDEHKTWTFRLSSSSSIPQPEGWLGHHRWLHSQCPPFSLFSTALWDLANSWPVHSLMLSSHLFLCLPCLLPPFTVPCKMVLARPDEQEMWPYHCSCISLRWSGGLCVVRLPAGSWHRLPCW